MCSSHRVGTVSRVVVLENTHNFGGGTVQPIEASARSA